jgi:hypothetical protein
MRRTVGLQSREGEVATAGPAFFLVFLLAERERERERERTNQVILQYSLCSREKENFWPARL